MFHFVILGIEQSTLWPDYEQDTLEPENQNTTLEKHGGKRAKSTGSYSK